MRRNSFANDRCWPSAAVDALACVLAALAVAAVFAAAPVAGVERVLGAESSDGQQIDGRQLGREALRAAPDFPWYDAESGRLQRLPVKPPKDAANRQSPWEAAPPKPPKWNFNAAWVWTALQILCLLLLAAIIAALIVLLIRTYLNNELRDVAEAGESVGEDREADEQRVERLPFPMRRPRADFLTEARRCYEQGQYGEAMIYLFSYELVELDRHHLIHLTKGKTNRQYLREVRSRPPLSEVLEKTIVAFEDVFFGKKTLPRDRFERCWQDLDQFHQQIGQVPS